MKKLQALRILGLTRVECYYWGTVLLLMLNPPLSKLVVVGGGGGKKVKKKWVIHGFPFPGAEKKLLKVEELQPLQLIREEVLLTYCYPVCA